MDNNQTDERLPLNPPDPNGEPVPVRDDGLGKTLSGLVATGVAVVLGTPVFVGMLSPCVGATRSARLVRAARESELADEMSRSQQDKVAPEPLTKPPAEQP